MMITCGGYGEDDDDSWEKKMREREIDGEEDDDFVYRDVKMMMIRAKRRMGEKRQNRC